MTGRLDGLAVDENGDFLHYNTIIDQTYNELFKDMELVFQERVLQTFLQQGNRAWDFRTLPDSTWRSSKQRVFQSV